MESNFEWNAESKKDALPEFQQDIFLFWVTYRIIAGIRNLFLYLNQ